MSTTELLFVMRLLVLWGGYELAKAALARRMTVAFIAAVAVVTLVLFAPLAVFRG